MTYVDEQHEQLAKRRTTLLRELAIEQASDAQLDGLVQLATRTALLLEGSSMKENQLRNLVNVADNAPGIEIILNFIRYQIARDQNWRYCYVRPTLKTFKTARLKALFADFGKQDFGHEVIADIEGAVQAAAH